MTNDEIRKSTATKIAIGINLLGVLIVLWMIAYPEPYRVALITGMLFPLIYMIIVILYKGLIRFNSSGYAFIACCIVLMVKSFQDFDILEYKRLWIAVSALTILIMLLLIILSPEFSLKTKPGWRNILSGSFFVLFYSFGTYTISDCLFDQSKDQLFKATIAKKKITYGTKSTTHHLYLNTWGPTKEESHIIVTSDQYDASGIGDSVDVHLRPGWLGTPWYSIANQ